MRNLNIRFDKVNDYWEIKKIKALVKYCNQI